MTRAIVDEGRFEIDTYQNNTGDSAYYNGHYYSDKAPGMAFLAVPAYYLAKQMFSDNFTPAYIEERVTFQKNVYENYNTSIISNITANIFFTTNLTPSELELNSMILVVIFTSVLFSSLGVVLVYRLSGFFLIKENLRVLATFAYGLGTLIFPYALVFFEHSVAAFFALTSFYFIFTQGKKPDKRKLLLAGVCAGIGVMISYVNILVFLPVVIYSVLLYRKNSPRNVGAILIGFVIGLLPLIFYNLVIFDKPAETAYNYVVMSEKPVKILLFDPSPFEAGKEGRMITLFNVKPLQLGGVMPRLLFLPYRGLFFYYPVLLFAMIGLYQMRNRYKKEALVILAMFVSVLLFNTFYGVWWGGGSFGPRYMTVLMPFLMIPIFVAISKMKNKYTNLLFLLLLSVSIFHNFVGVQTFEDFKFQGDEDLNARLNSFRDIGNPLYDYYLPLFLDRGPRSHIIENIFDEKPGIDVRDLNPVIKLGKLFTLPPIGLILLELKFVPLIIVMLMLWILWPRDRNFRILNIRNISLALILIIAASLLTNLKVGTLFYSNDWNVKGTNETGRWMPMKGTIYLYSNEEEPVMFNLTALSFNNQFDINMYLNDNLVDKFKINPALTNTITNNVTIRKGENVIRFVSEEKCLIPFVKNISEDRRCLSMNLIGMDKIKLENDVIYAKNWYLPEKNGKWMSEEGKIFIFRNVDSAAFLNISLTSYYRNREVWISLNDDPLKILAVSPENRTTIYLNTSLDKGLNVLSFALDRSCDLPADVENSTDKRCLSIFLNDFEVRHGT